MRTGADYRQSLRDGRRVWVMGEGFVDDVATHRSTRDVVNEYVAWYDRHTDRAWQDTLLAALDTSRTDANQERVPYAMLLPRNAADLRGMGRSFSATTFLNAGNLTHTPAYGHLIALGILAAVQDRNVSAKQIADAEAYRTYITASGRFLTFCAGAATIGYRMRPDPEQRATLRIVRETAEGLVISGKVGMHTSPAFAEDVYIGSHCGVPVGQHQASFVVAVNAPGVTVVCRKRSAREDDRFVSALSSRNDELDGQMWLDQVFVPHERVFLLEPTPEPIARWLFWHQLYCWLSKAEFTLGLALACTHAMGLMEHPPTIDLLIDMMTDVQTVRSCLTAAECDPSFTAAGYCYPNHNHIAAGSLAMLKARQRITETMRILPGSSLVVAPSAHDLADPDMAEGLTESFAGGGYTALQRAALLQLASDHVSSALDGRESAFELHANGGIPAWRGRLRRSFGRYEELANAVLQHVGVPMPPVDLSSIPAAPLAPRRPVRA